MSHGFARKGLTSEIAAPGGAWQRKADWLTLPSVGEGEQKIVLLYAVFNGPSNYVAFTITGNYTVDWGDGTTPQDVSSDVKAQRNLAWADYSADTLTSQGYRQAIVTITPRSGQNITGVNFTVRHDTPTVAHSDGLLEVRMSTPFATSITFSAAGNVAHAYGEQVEVVGTTAITSCNDVFRSWRALGSVVGTEWTANGSNFSGMFNGCSSLQTIPLLNTAAGTNFSSMFASCSSLQQGALSGTRFTISYASCLLSASALDDIYTNLGTASGGAQTITVSSNFGTTGDTPSIATAKGWSVSGS